MTRKKHLLATSGLIVALAVAGCAQQGGSTGGSAGMSKTTTGALAGAALGALAGGLTQGHDKAKRALIGAGIGALAGAAVGNYMDKQEQQLKSQLAGSGVDVSRNGDSIVLNLPEAITFDVGSAKLKPEAQEQLGKIGGVIKEYPQTIIDIAGHTDSTGSPETNMALSQKRAGTVAAYLARSGGLDFKRMVVNGYGESRPIADNGSEAGRAQNRRVEITLLPLTQG
ncbi:OmpA family protein [Plasticicumulans acidivorans]|uniref:Outer membrane protein OmpA-like peptidoglycan-associated protein n=1 Tax=Plasticicumulans acidivorans TaxID=886464 RepID=A0A317MZA7_9GAMM|nr:OmpA family protein [Plasticicumulans acidivorans]PWV64894.1 outer membrane protein OmpA-like peptidoglycan-associated protein [Plasticicumulans acidivorans]